MLAVHEQQRIQDPESAKVSNWLTDPPMRPLDFLGDWEKSSNVFEGIRRNPHTLSSHERRIWTSQFTNPQLGLTPAPISSKRVTILPWAQYRPLN